MKKNKFIRNSINPNNRTDETLHKTFNEAWPAWPNVTGRHGIVNCEMFAP